MGQDYKFNDFERDYCVKKQHAIISTREVSCGSRALLINYYSGKNISFGESSRPSDVSISGELKVLDNVIIGRPNNNANVCINGELMQIILKYLTSNVGGTKFLMRTMKDYPLKNLKDMLIVKSIYQDFLQKKKL